MPSQQMYKDTLGHFIAGDFVTPLDHGISTTNTFYGVVSHVDKKANKVVVEWNGGRVAQHDPQDLSLYAVLMGAEQIQRRFRMPTASLDANINGSAVKEQTVGNPENHGTGESGPLSGGFNEMQQLVKNLRTESYANAGIVMADDGTKLMPRRAVYHRTKGRIYQRSKQEVTLSAVNCPKCKTGMERQKFTRRVSLYACTACGFKITSDKLV